MTDANVLILTNKSDYAADEVVHLLGVSGVPVIRWNAEDLGQRPLPSWSVEAGLADRPRSIWWRQFTREVEPTLDVTQYDVDRVTASQWRAYLAILDEPGSYWMNPLYAARAAEDKIRQLRVASQIGMPLPQTLVCNSRDEAKRFDDSNGASVVKALSAPYFALSDQAFMFTEPLTPELLQAPDDWLAQPVIVQERIERAADVRVFVVDTFVTAASAYAEGSDWRLISGQVEWKVFDLAPSLAVMCREVVRRLGLTYGAIDFALDNLGKLHFLEINQAGEYSFIDRPLQLGVARAIARVLSKGKC